ncbi:MAG: hypothetical protein WCP52_12765 [Bacteroidota bacterium]
MRKIAIFVEGQTELVFVREFIKHKYCYNVNIDCFQLFKEGNLVYAPYPCVNPNAEVHYTLINVGNDVKVPSAICDRENSLFTNGFEKVIGLRDMYCQAYKEITTEIDENLNAEFITETNELIRLRSNNYENIHICFSIMEIESWFLAMHHIFEKIHPTLTVDFIKQKLELDLTKTDPEEAFFHPVKTFSKIYELAEMSYEKKRGDIESFCNNLCADDFEKLYHSSVCKSFNQFCDKIA